MANMNMKIHGVVEVQIKEAKQYDGIERPVHYRTLIVKNADGTSFELDLFGDTLESVSIKEVA